MRQAKYRQHPLMMLFGNKRLLWRDGMNILQEHGLISDNCVEVEDVAICDAMNVLARVPDEWAKPFRKQQTNNP